jgi:uncharacterized protein
MNEQRCWLAVEARDASQNGTFFGEYQYFRGPLPVLVRQLRQSLYAHLAPLANRWAEQLRQPHRYPPTHAEFREQCRAAGQTRLTPLLLRYGAGDYNCLHQDLNGALAFPLQAVILLNEPGSDFDGDEFVLFDQRPRALHLGYHLS